jgi:hypothetical protein
MCYFLGEDSSATSGYSMYVIELGKLSESSPVAKKIVEITTTESEE